MKPSLSWLLIFVPITVGLHFLASDAHLWIFLSSCAAIIPLAGWMGRATEHLAEHTGEGVGGLLNATFGNAAELIIAFAALREGLLSVVKASLTGSILGNLLLVLGASFLGGGLKRDLQRFNATAARMQSTMLFMAAVSLILPASFHYLGGAGVLVREKNLSLWFAFVLLGTYALGLLFSLRTHVALFSGTHGEAEALEEETHGAWSWKKALGVLALATAAVAWMSEILVGSVEQAAHAMGMTDLFVGVVVVAIIGNAAEHSTAVLVAIRNRMDLSVSIAIGSSIQIALFVAPVLVLLSYWVAPQPMDLVFSPAEVLAVLVAVVICAQVASDGESHWLEGAQLLAVYVLLGLLFYFLPASAGHVPPPHSLAPAPVALPVGPAGH
ncbi:MAG TPA: calcium/proton exchanger [Thermoanaerobaculia bacterium]|nr:calcium/proton exchanger [Thermoanaerobaculia bacterium]